MKKSMISKKIPVNILSDNINYILLYMCFLFGIIFSSLCLKKYPENNYAEIVNAGIKIIFTIFYVIVLICDTYSAFSLYGSISVLITAVINGIFTAFISYYILYNYSEKIFIIIPLLSLLINVVFIAGNYSLIQQRQMKDIIILKNCDDMVLNDSVKRFVFLNCIAAVLIIIINIVL